MEKKRDLSLDYMKGFSCFFIVIAHSIIFPTPILGNNWIIATIYQGVNIFTMVYFASSGALANIQTGRDRLSRIFMLYGFLFFLGFSYNAIIAKYYFFFDNPSLEPDGRNFYVNVYCEILQLISVGCMMVAAASKLFKERNYLYYAVSFLPFILYKLLFPVMPDFPLRGFIFAKGTVVAFSLIPWTGFFFAGVFAYRTDNRINAMLAGFYLILYVILSLVFEINLDWLNKWNMSYGFFILSSMVLHANFFFFRLIRDRLPEGKNPLILFGRDTLLFLVINVFLTYYFAKFKLVFWFLAWPGISLMTYFLMRLIIYLDSKIKYQLSDYKIWFGLIILIFITPLIFHFNIKIIIHIEFVYGLLLALRYRDLSALIKKGGMKTAVS